MIVVPKGRLLVIGGAEDKGNGNVDIAEKNKDFRQFDILQELIKGGERKRHHIEIITTASQIPDEIGKMYQSAFNKLGFENIGFMNIKTKEEARKKSYLKKVEKAGSVFFTGGDQFRLSTILGDTEVINLIRERYFTETDFTVAGTSAGAMALSNLMIFEGENNEAMLKGSVKISSGLGLINHCIIDTHFVKRGRFGRLTEALVMNPTCIGIGIGEDTALIIKKGNQVEVRGSGMVTIIDGRDIGHTNIAFADAATPLCVENLRVHILCRGNRFLLSERKFLPGPEQEKKKLKPSLN
jgi:cyanophycinase